jgi:pimeloyl-ACP methyl ester carboxylesterase
LYGWFVYHERIADQIPTLVYFHENDYFPPVFLNMIEKLIKNPQEYNVVMVDYRRYGYSQGTPSEKRLYNDCHAIMNAVLGVTEIDQNLIFIFGTSLAESW